MPEFKSCVENLRLGEKMTLDEASRIARDFAVSWGLEREGAILVEPQQFQKKDAQSRVQRRSEE